MKILLRIVPWLAMFASGYVMGNALPIPTNHVNFSWFYYSQVGDQQSLGIKPNGEFVFGPRCDGATEAKKFWSVMKQLKEQRDNGLGYEPPRCRSSSYWMPKDGIIPFQTGPANPPLHATERHL